MDNWRQKYQERINSADWKRLRERLIFARGGVCQKCKFPSRPLQLHHKTYERLGKERDCDLEVLCVPCHRKADKERAEIGKVNSRAALYEAQLDGWASRKYGEDWADSGDYESIADEFFEWQERQDY